MNILLAIADELTNLLPSYVFDQTDYGISLWSEKYHYDIIMDNGTLTINLHNCCVVKNKIYLFKMFGSTVIIGSVKLGDPNALDVLISLLKHKWYTE